MIDAELNHIMDMEDRKSKGLIGETYTKLAEIMESKERAESCVGQTQTYIEHVTQVIKGFEGQSREDVQHIQERIERLRKLINDVEVALMKNEV